MRIDQLKVSNFKGFKEASFTFHPQFNLLIGENGSGKTALLEALSVALGGWFLGMDGMETRNILHSEVHLAMNGLSTGEMKPRSSVHWERYYPCYIQAAGEVSGVVQRWTRTLAKPNDFNMLSGNNIQKYSRDAQNLILLNRKFELPLIGYYGTGRLWNSSNPSSDGEVAFLTKEETSRLFPYRSAFHPRISLTDLTRWIMDQTLIGLQFGEESTLWGVVQQAMVHCLEGAKSIYYNFKVKSILIEFSDGSVHSFDTLSDGQRTMLAMVADMASKAVQLNSHLGEQVLQETKGVVLIDELDLHLHPRWQQHVIEDLTTLFPKVQFMASTHSPFLIQSLRDGGQLIDLQGNSADSLDNLGIETIAAGIMGVKNPEAHPRYMAMLEAAKEYLSELSEAESTAGEQLEAYKQKLSQRLAPFAQNPAFQAVLEMERLSRLGG
ncbi:MAG: AAA family ATPase [Magnetococcales bacterium]|nr:AAA family ATPase [Magnetococcales bacterium]NGZ25933.1 AAA family ATPase [Magnetococcales bacterium]